MVRTNGRRRLRRTCGSCCCRCPIRSSTRPCWRSGCPTARWRRLPATSIRSIRSRSPTWCSRNLPSDRRSSASCATFQPELVGLSVMTFQRATARRIIAFIRSIDPAVRVVVGGYDPSLAPDAWTHPDIGVDFIVRGEADLTFRDLVRALEGGMPLSAVAGLWYRIGTTFQCTPPRPVTAIEDGTIKPPNRAARVLSGYTMLGRGRRRRRDIAGLHLRLQLLLDHRDARPQFPPLPDSPRDRRHPRRAEPGRARHLLRRRQHHDRRPAVRGAVPRDHRGWPRRRRLHRAGHDGADRGARRDARAADAPGRIPLRVPRHREHPRRGPRLPQGTGEEQPARRGASAGAMRRSTRSTCSTATACWWSAG